MIKKYIVGTLVVGMLSLNGIYDISNSYNLNINDVKIVSHTKSSLYKSDVYDLENGCTMVVNNELRIYELFTEELGDWSVECKSYKELLQYVKKYSKHKNDYKKYDNHDISYKEYDGKYVLSNGIRVTKSKDVNYLYLPIFGGFPYKCNKNDTKNIIATYLENIK